MNDIKVREIEMEAMGDTEWAVAAAVIVNGNTFISYIQIQFEVINAF